MKQQLSIDSSLLRQAFGVASKLNVDLSKEVETFIRRFVKQDRDNIFEITPFVASLGVNVASNPLQDEQDYLDHLDSKYK